MSMYKKAYKILLEGINEALREADKEIKEAEDEVGAGRQYEIYGILCHAMREAEEELVNGSEEV